jgi:hypothetical protein
MRQLLKKISVIISAIMLVIASGGFSFYQHYCNCTDEVNSSVVIKSTDCHEDEKSHTCSTVQIDNVTSCCQAEINQNILNQKCETTNNCCTTEYTFLKTDNFDNSFNQKKSFSFVAAYVINLETTYTQKDHSFLKKNTFTDDLPPPEYGKELLITLHQFKIASPLV